MKQFTVKDFIGYNNPCFSCSKAISFRICTVNSTIPGSTAAVLRPTVSLDQTEVDLRTTYTETLKLWIFHQTNKIISSKYSELIDYLDKHSLFLASNCDSCGSGVHSQLLEFNLDKGYIKPTSISNESLLIYDGDSLYEVYSDFTGSKTSVLVNKLDGTHSSSHPIAPIRFELPLFPLYKFKSKKRFLEKIKTYLVFS